ncbi:MAG: sulfatase-like hydrolase/transferase [Bacteroidetes bacterium]|nr:sulfatase-like hydrolase/transferase [Bacteroidota bacterium]
MFQRLKIPKLIRWIFSTGIIFLLLMIALRLCLFFFFDKQGNHFTDIFPALFLGLRYDLKMISILLMFMLIFGSIPYIHPFNSSRGKGIWLIIIGLASFIFIFFYSVDFAHYSYLSQRLNASVLNYLADTSISMNMVWQTYPVIKIIILLIVGTWFIRFLVVTSYLKIKKNPYLTTKRNTLISYVASFLLFAFFIFGRIGQFNLRWSDAFELGSDYKANLALNPFQTFFSSLKFRHSGYDQTKVLNSIPVLNPYFGFTATDTSMLFERDISPKKNSSVNKPNVIVVICESFSAYKSSMFGNPLNTTPFFNEMSRNGIFFERCFTPTYGTARGVWAIVTGIPDVEEIASTTSSRNPKAVDQHSIINDFEGYNKLYFLGGSASWANIRGLLDNNIRGLRLYEQDSYNAPKIDVWGISDKNLFLEANMVLKKQTAPFFAVIQTADNHRPYTIPEEDRQAFHKITVPQDSLTKFGFESNDEMNAFRYTDFGYRTFIEAAQKEKYFNNTIFLFVGDHGIPGNAGDMFPKSWTDQRLTAEHVPLLIYAPGILQSRRISSLCSQLDVLPTLAGLCNISYRNTTFGRDILDSTYGDAKALSFIFDPDQQYVGLVKGDFLFRKQLKTGKEEIVSVKNNQPVDGSAENDATKKEMKSITESIFETAKYLLFHNKKKK